MNFFLKIRNSIYSPQFYASIPKQSFGGAFGYFFLLILLMTVISCVSTFISWGGFTTPQREVEKFLNSAVSYFPDNLIVTFKDGKASTNVTEPYYLPLAADQQEEAKNLVVIDTKTPFSATQFNEYSTFVWLTKDSLIVKGDDEIRAIDLSKVEDMVIDKQFVNSIHTRVQPWLKIITPLVIVGLILVIYIAYIFRLVYLLIFALIIMLVAKIMKKPLSYGGAYKTGLYVMTLGFFLELLPLQTHTIPLFFTLINLGVLFFNLLPAQKAKK